MISYVTEIQPADGLVLLLIHRIDDSNSLAKQTHVVAEKPFTQGGVEDIGALARFLTEAFHEIRIDEMERGYAKAIATLDQLGESITP